VRKNNSRSKDSLLQTFFRRHKIIDHTRTIELDRNKIKGSNKETSGVWLWKRLHETKALVANRQNALLSYIIFSKGRE
jgi:hypothetical protein